MFSLLEATIVLYFTGTMPSMKRKDCFSLIYVINNLFRIILSYILELLLRLLFILCECVCVYRSWLAGHDTVVIYV